MPTPHDILLARITEAYGLASAEDVARCLAEQEAARARAEPVSLGAIMVKLEVLSPFQRAGLEDLIRQDALGQDNIPTDRLAGRQTGAPADPAAPAVDDTPSTRLLPARTRTIDGQDQGPQPAVIAGYAVLRELGRGGMGVVYEAIQIELVRRVALKVLSEPSLEPEAKERHRREALAAAKLSHPNVVRIYDCGEIDGLPYIAMEYVPGVAMSRLIGDPEMTFLRAARLIVQAADGLSALHAMGVIHRDIKPANLLVTPDERLLVTDFGLAKDAAATTITRTNQIMGTPRYMSPEQAEGASDQIDHRTDIYSLGATLYELATGKPIFDDAVGNVLHQVLLKEPKKPSVHRKDITKDYETVILKAIAKDSADRYQTAEEFAEDLHRLIAGRPVLARPLGLPEKLWRLMRRNPAVTLVILIVLMITGIAVAVAADRAQIRAEQAEREARRRQSLELIRQAQELTERVKVIVDPDATFEEEEAAAAAARERFKLALGLLDQAEVLDPECAQAYRMEAELYFALFDCDSAFRALREYTRVSSQTAWSSYFELHLLSVMKNSDVPNVRTRLMSSPTSPAVSALLRAEDAVSRCDARSAIEALESNVDWTGWEAEKYRHLSAAHGCSSANSELRRSIENLNRAVSIGPAAYSDFLSLSQIFRSLGEFGEAREALLNAMGHTLDPTRGLLALGSLATQMRDVDKARACFERAIRLESVDPSPFLFRAEMHLKLGEFPEAESDLREALARSNTRTMGIYARMIELSRTWHGPEPARTLFESLTQAGKIQPSYCANEDWPSMSYLVDELIELQLYPQALSYLDAAARQSGLPYDHSLSLGHVHFRMGNVTLAIEAFTKAIHQAPTQTKIYVWRSRAFARAKNHTACLQDLTTAIKFDPEDRDLYLKRATRLFEFLRVEAGLRDIQTVVLMSELSEVEAIRDTILGKSTSAWTQSISSSVRAYAIHALPNLAARLIKVGEQAITDDELARAEAALLRARVVDPASSVAAYALSRVHARKREWELCVLRLAQALDLKHPEPQAVLTDPEFASLRTRSEFQSIQTRLDALKLTK